MQEKKTRGAVGKRQLSILGGIFVKTKQGNKYRSVNNICFLFFSLMIFSWLETASAQILIEEGKVTLDVVAGQTVTGTLNVHNTSDKPIKVKAYWEDFQYTSPYDGKKKFFPAGTLSSSVGKWVKFSPLSFELAPQDKQVVNYTVNVSDQAKGGYYGVLFFEVDSQNSASQTGLTIVSRVGSLFYVETKDRIKQAEILEFKPSSVQTAIEGSLRNEGNVVLVFQVIYYALNSENYIVQRGQTERFFLPAQETANFIIPIAKDIKPDKYTSVLTFDLGNADGLSREVDFQIKNDRTLRILEIRD